MPVRIRAPIQPKLRQQQQGVRRQPAQRAGPLAPAALVQQVGGMYSEELGIDLESGDSAGIFKWFLAAVLLGAPISGALALRTWRKFSRAGLLTPQALLDAGWDRLVQVLDSGGYARYDFKTATKLMDACRELVQRYGGDLNRLHAACDGEEQLEGMLRGLAKGIGEVTVNIFLRELRGRWRHAEPLPLPRVIAAAQALHYVPAGWSDRERILRRLQHVWEKDGGSMEGFPHFEAALLRHSLPASRRHP